MSSFDLELEKELEKLKKKKKKDTVTPQKSKTNTFDEQLEAELESLKKKGRNTGKDTGKYSNFSVSTTDDIAPVNESKPSGSVFDITLNRQKYSQMSSVLNQATDISKKILSIDNRPKYGAMAQDDAYWNKERERLQTELDTLVSGYGNLGNLRTQTQTLSQQLKLAQYQQKGSKMASVVDANSASYDKDFSNLAKEDKTVSDDLYEFVNNRNNAQAVKFNPAQHYNNAQPMQTTPYGAMASAPVVPETNTEAVRNQYQGKGYHLLTDEEKSVFNYYWAKEGKEKAVEWLDSLQLTLNERMANQNVENIGDSVTQKILFGAQAGFNQFSTGIDSAVNAVAGKDEFTVPNVTQITSSKLREGMSGVEQVAYDLTTSTANMLPSILASTAANFIVPGSGAVVGAATMGASAGGNAYQDMINQGYDAKQAKAYGLLVGGSESVLQYALGGITKLGGGNGEVFESLIGKALPSVENGLAKFALQYGGKMLDEGLEEGIQEVLDPVFQRMVGNPDAETDWGEVAYSALLGALSAGVLESSSIPSAVKAYKNGIDPVSGLNSNEKQVVDKLHKDLIAEEEQNGKVSQKRKDEIYDEILERMDRGDISTETIEEVLGGENYKAYQDIIEQDNKALTELAELYEGDELKQKAEEFVNNSKRNELAKTLSDSVYDMVKDSRLGESYRDRARRGQKFEADVTKYDEKQRVIVQKAIDSGVLNNTNRTHDMVDFVARVSADTGVLFDFTNNEKLKDSIFAVNGKTVDGYITKDGITINVNSPRYINTVVGHEITHALEGSKLYDTLEKTIFEYAKEKGTYKDVLKDAYEMYRGEEGYQGYEGLKKIKKEAVANLVGDYLFTDKNFVNHLSAKHQNIFQKVWNEVKYMVKIARAGSNEAKKLLEVQKAFEDAYRAANAQKTTTEGGGVTYSYSKPDFTKDEWSMVNRRKHSEFDNPKFDLDNDTKWMYFNEKGSTVFAVYSKNDAEDPTVMYGTSGEKADRDFATLSAYLRGELNAKRTKTKPNRRTLNAILADIQRTRQNENNGIPSVAERGTATGNVQFPVGESGGNGRQNPGNGTDNRKGTELTEYNEEASAEEQDASFITFSNDYAAIRNFMKEGDVGEESDDAPVKYSLSKDSDGKQLTKEQQEYFKDSKIIDRNGNLLKVYHTTNSDFTVFDDSRKGSNTDADNSYLGHFFTDDPEYMAQFPEFKDGKTEAYYLNMKKPIDTSNISKQAFLDIVEVTGGDVQAAAELYDQEYEAEVERAKNRGDNNTILELPRLLEELTGEYFYESDFHEVLRPNYDKLIAKGYDGIINNMDGMGWANEYIVLDSNQAKLTSNTKPTANPDIRYSLSAEQKEYFKDSVVRDENGNLKVMYHGTSRGGHTVFDSWGKSHYGLFGTGSYFTDSKSIAESYTKKGKGTNPQIYETYLNITNPLDMDAPADPSKWAKAFDEVDFPESGTNEEFYRAVEEYYADQYMPKWEVAEIIRESIEFGMGYDGITHIGGGRVNPDGERHRVYIAFNPEQVKNIDNVKPTDNPDIRYSLSDSKKLKDVGLDYDAKNETVSYSMSSLEDAFDYNKSETDYLASRLEYETALAKSIAVDKDNVTEEEMDKAKRYLDSLFLIHDMIAMDRDRLDYEAAVGKSAWVSNAEYGGSIDFSTLCAKRRLFTGTFDAIQNELPDTVLDENDFLQIRNMLLEKELESPCSMCYVEGSRAKHGVYVAKFLKEYKQTNPEWMPQIADFTSTTRLEQTRINHPEAYQAYVDAMNKLSQRKPKEASVRTDYRGEILRDFKDTSTVAEKNKNGGVRFNSFSDFEIIHAIDCMQVLTDMARVGLNGQAYTKVKEFAEAFGNTGLKINLSLVAKDVDANGKLIMDETNGMKYDEAMDLRNRYSENVGTVIVVFNEAQLRAALADSTIDYVLPFHRSQWRKSQYTMMGLPTSTKDFTNYQNDRIKNPKSGRDVKLSKIKHISEYTNDITGETFEIKDNIMPNQYWDFNLDGRGNAQRYLDYINANGMTPKFNFLLDKVDGKWVLPEGAVGDGYFKVLIDFKMYNNDGWGSPQNPVVPEFNMPFIQQMLENYKGGHQAFPVAHDVVSEFVEGKKSGKFSLSNDGTLPIKQGNWHISGKDVAYEDIAPVRETVSKTESVAPVAQSVAPAKTAPAKEEYLAVTPKRKKEPKMVMVDAPFVQKTANILAEEPKVQKKKSGLWSMFKENVLDNGMVFEDLALKTKNRDLQAKWNFIRYSQSRAQKLIGDGADGVKSLNAIREEVEKSGKTQKFYEYLYHWLNVDRMTLENRYEDTPNKAVFGDSVTADMSRSTAVQLGKENPEFRKWAQDVYRYNRHLRNLMVDKGVISQETADLWAEMYPHYVPIRRVDDAGLNINVPLDTGRTGVNAPIKRATGGNSDILPLFDTMAQRTLQTYKAIAKNSFGVELKNTLGTTITKEQTDVDGVIDSMDNHEGLLQEGKNGKKPTFTVFENGEKVTFEITDEMYNAMKPASDLLSYTNPIANTISNVHRGLLTEYNPVFMTTNAIKDTQDILINSQHPVKTYANLPRATWELAKKGKWFREYMENGGEDNSYFDSDTNSFDTKEKGVRKLLGIPPLSWISKANNFIERTPRLAEYITSREAGRSIEVSMLDAARVTTNFAAGGKLTKFANRNGATFLNASVQGAVQQARNIREAKANGLKGWAQLAGKFALAGLPAVLLNGLMWDDDDDYEELSDYVKQNYYIVGKYGDGKFVRIPKGRTLAVIQNAIEQVANAATGNDEVDLKSFLELAISNLAPNNPIENNILAPIIQVAKNETWYGEDLVPTRLQDLPASEQYDESTDAISKWLGEKLNISPYKINYLLDQYSGGIGDTILPMLTPEAESGDNSFLGNMIAPLKSKFTTDSVMNNQNVSDFYDTKDELTTNAKASTATDEDVLMNKYINSVNAELSELYAKKREIQNSNYSDSLKYSMVRDIQKQIVDLTREGLDTYKGVSINGEFATVGDRYFKKNEEGEWQKMSDEQVTKHKVTSAAGDSPYATDGKNHYRFYVKEGETEGEWRKITDEQLDKQNEVTKGLGISAADYWGKKEEYDYAYEHPENYAVAKAVGGYDSYKAYSDELYDIKADKDENGKSISGSRKEKVIDYLNNLDADYYTKIILFKNEYNADDTYNDEIVEYLNSRDDITYQEMVTILKKLGFTVKGNTVTW